MEDNRIQETKEVLEQTANLIKNIQSGNFIAAAKQAIKLLKSKQAKKMLKKQMIKIALQALPSILVVVMLFAIVTSMKDKMVSLLSNISTTVGGMWQWMTDDYWIKLDEEIEYVVDTETGETLGTTEEVDVTDGREIEKYTLVDKYIKELGNMGISIKDLRLLGEADYSDMESLLKDKNNKKLIEKYISEFVRADLITQEFHKRRGNELVSKANEDYIDGGIYLYRSKKEQTITEDQFNNGSYKEENIEVDDKDYKQMTYVDKDKFDEMIANNDKDARYSFSIDRDTGELLVAQITTTTVVEADVSNTINSWFADLYDWLSNYNLAGTTTYELETVRIPYKDLISKYTMPYEFLINLCEITQNPEFVYHIALLARDTNIVLAIQDNTTITRETVEIEEDKEEYKNKSSSSVSGASLVDEKTEKTRKVTTITTQTPVLRIEYADTWSFYEEFEYTKNIEGTIEEIGPITQKIPLPSTLSGHHEGGTKTEISYEGVPIEVTTPEYWYDTFTVETRTKTQMIVATTTYNETGDPTENSVEKSKQFLGLLRNSDGECPYDCFDHWNQAKYCSEDAEFDRYGINVKYKIPNMTREESPLNKLTSGLEILYSAMQATGSNNSSDVQNYDPDTDYGSIYNQKMQGLVEHMRYLMTFPENESYTVKDLLLDILPIGDDDEYEDVKEDELELLYRVCEAEAGGSSEEEIGHVASVILNRVKAAKWPNTISGVVYQANQFASVQRPDFDTIVPSEKTKRAVDYVVKNGDTTGGAFYFRTKQSAINAGMPTSKTEDHDFYIFLFMDPNTHCFYTDKDIGGSSYPIKKDSYIVTIDAGHGPKPDNAVSLGGYWAVGGVKYYTSGTQGTYNGVTYTEHETTRQVADKVASILASNPKISPVRIGNSAANPIVRNDERIPMAKNANSDLHVTIHFNGGAESANGTECLASPGDMASIQFANIMTDTVSSALGTKKRSVISNQNWAIIKPSLSTGFPNIIVEGLFMSNQGDMAILANGGIDKYAQGVADGILQYLGL